MAEYTLAAHMGSSVRIDACAACQAIWFDGYESLQLTPGSTLRLFSIIGDLAAAPKQVLREPVRCPRCSLRLQPVEDMQRMTRFRYRRCAHGHGRFISFLDFLREKDFVRPMSAGQVAALREQVGTVNCSNCGAPIDLAKGTSCPHCGSPLSMLDLQHARRLIEQLAAADPRPDATGPDSEPVEHGLKALARWAARDPQRR
jgi:hypothetical protein